MFKTDFKYYKSKLPPPDFNDVLDLNNLNEKVHKVKPLIINNESQKFSTLRNPNKWEIYEITDNPGLFFIKNPFTNIGQRYWIVKSLSDYTKKPNKTNLDAHCLIPPEEDVWDFCQNKHSSVTLDKLRWAVVGYHHDWDSKVYDEKLKSAFPIDLKLLCAYVAKQLGITNFNAEAAIVNFYHMNSTLSGHIDHSEPNLEAPLFSFSFGQSAIFLIGGTTIDTKPTALYLRSGDVLVMTGPSRLCYHGIPRIIKCDREPWDENVVRDDTLGKIYEENLWAPFRKYLKYSRININVRQVLKPGQKSLND